MIFRHFKPGSIAWEDKDHPNVYSLIELKPNRAAFMSEDGSVKLTYALIDKDKLDVIHEEKKEVTAFH